MKPNTPTGCPTPAVITRAMMDLLGMQALFVNAGLVYPPVVPCLDLYGDPGGDPRQGDAVLRAREIYSRGQQAGQLLSAFSDLLVLGECVPGGTTTALCVLRGLDHPAQVSSSFVNNPVAMKEEICRYVQDTIRSHRLTDPLDVVRVGGDPMIAAAAGILSTYRGQAILAGGTQMLAVAAVAGPTTFTSDDFNNFNLKRPLWAFTDPLGDATVVANGIAGRAYVRAVDSGLEFDL